MFCDLYCLFPLPTHEQLVLWYVTFLDLQGIKPTSIKVYLAVVNSLHIMHGLSGAPHGGPRIKLALKGLLDHAPTSV